MAVARLRFLICAVALVGVFAPPVSGDHSWGTYHWFRTANPLRLAVGRNISVDWDTHLTTAINDWNGSQVLDLEIVPGGTTGRRCRPTTGRIEVCSSSYGNNGWLGIAQIWVSGDHITQATTKVNDFYFTDVYGYDSPEWRQFVMCQEIGHDFGLDHQDEDFDNPNLGSCMDYTSDPTSNQHPDDHDFAQLASIYQHLDLSAGGGGGGGGRGRGNAPNVQLPPAATGAGPGDTPQSWGELVRTNRRGGLFRLDLGAGQVVFTFVIWA
jgi:hypothetical protein